MISHTAFLALFAFAYLMVSERLEKTILSGALLFILVGWVLGSSGLRRLSFEVVPRA